MELVNCVNCDHLVSTSAVKCPKCNIEKPWDRRQQLWEIEYEKRKKNERLEYELHKQKLDEFANTLIPCPDCGEKRPNKFYLKCYYTEPIYSADDPDPNPKPSSCPNCGCPFKIKCDACRLDIGVVSSRAIVYKYIDNCVSRLCYSHRDITLYGLEVSQGKRCQDCGKKISFLRRIFGHLCSYHYLYDDD